MLGKGKNLINVEKIISRKKYIKKNFKLENVAMKTSKRCATLSLFFIRKKWILRSLGNFKRLYLTVIKFIV